MAFNNDYAVKQFIEILKAQPNLLPQSTNGEAIAKVIIEGARELKKFLEEDMIP